MKHFHGIPLAVFAFVATPAAADLMVVFDEGAPKDRFTLTNAGDCALERARVTLDLSTSPAGLIFDVTGQGAGVDVFQPLELTEGASTLAALPRVRDGESMVVLEVVRLDAGAALAFTSDVDDTLGGREITVSGAEIAGAHVRVATARGTTEGVFGPDARARVVLDDCD